MQEKMYLKVCGTLLGLANIVLIDTRFNLVGLGLGIAGAILLIKALRIKQ